MSTILQPTRRQRTDQYTFRDPSQGLTSASQAPLPKGSTVPQISATSCGVRGMNVPGTFQIETIIHPAKLSSTMPYSQKKEPWDVTGHEGGPLSNRREPREIFFFNMWWYQKSEGYTPKRTSAVANHSGTWSQPCSLQNSKTKPHCFQISQSIKYVTGVQTTTVEPGQAALLLPLSHGELTLGGGFPPCGSSLP